MTLFDQLRDKEESYFVKSDSKVLKSMYGRGDLLPLWIADMDFQVAPQIINELQKVVSRGVFAYEFHPSDLYDVMANWFLKRHKLNLNTRSFVYTPSVLNAIALILQEFTAPKDGVLIQTPVYHMFESLINKGERNVVTNQLLLKEGGYEMDYKGLESKIVTNNVKMMILCNPHNPVGRVWKEHELLKLIEILGKHEVLLVSDEIHADIIYGMNEFCSTIKFDYKKQLVLLGSPSKTFGLQGVANGFVYSDNNELRVLLERLTEKLAIDHGNTLTAFATKSAYLYGEEWLESMLEYLQNTISWAMEYVETEIPEIKILQPEGTYLLWLDFRGVKMSNEEIDNLVIEKARLALGKGTVFGSGGSGFMRMTIASPLEKIQQAFYQLKEAIQTI